MTKEEMIKKIQDAPEDILEEAYVFDVIQGQYIQTHFNSKILEKYHSQIECIHISENGFLKFIINGQEIRMT